MRKMWLKNPSKVRLCSGKLLFLGKSAGKAEDLPRINLD